MSDRERQAGEAGSTASKGDRLGQVIVLIWALGVFYHYYQSQGFFELVAQVVRHGP